MKKSQSFSLVEVLVATAIFAMVVMVVMSLIGTLGSVSIGTRSQQEMLSGGKFFVEKITKDIQQSTLDTTMGMTNYRGLLLSNSAVDCTNSGDCGDNFVTGKTGIIVQCDGIFKYYYLYQNSIYLKTAPDIAELDTATQVKVIPGNIKVNDFSVIGSSNTANNSQPWAKISIEFEGSGFIRNISKSYKLSTLATVRKKW